MIAFIGVGSNVGDRQSYIDQAVDLINQKHLVLMQAPIIETMPVGHLDQGPFLNTVISIEVAGSPHQMWGSARNLLRFLNEIENQLGRERIIENGPRTIDLDILMFGQLTLEIVRGQALTIPHPRMHERRFVLEPLCEIAPNFVHPTLRKTVSELLKSLPD